MLGRSSSYGRSCSLAISHLGRTYRENGGAACPYQKSTVTLAENLEAAKPYEMIPGPKPLPIIGNIPRFLPVVGEYGRLPLLEMVNRLRENYGDIVKLEGIPGRRRCVFLFDPNDCEMVYRTEGPWPWRIAMETMQLYRKRRNKTKGGFGLVSIQGEDWHRFRTKVNQHLMQPRTIRPHVRPIDRVASDFVDKIRALRDPDSLEVPASFNNEMNKWALESICTITLDHRMGCLESNLSPDSEPQILIDGVHRMFDLLYKLEILPSLWKLYDTRNLKSFFKVLDDLTEITKRYVDQAKRRLSEGELTKETGERSLLERLIGVDEETATVMMMDMLIAGVDTTSNSASTAIYYIATNPGVQEKLREEARKVLPDKSSPVTMDTLENIPYTKAVIKESMRMMPIAVGNLRTTSADIVIGGYRIPEGDDVIMCHALMSQEERHFPDPMKFLPERWLRESSAKTFSAKNAHPFAYMPFGFGPRTCIGRRFAQLEMETLLIKMVRNFRLEWNYGTLKFKSGFINTVESPLKLKLIDIDA